VFIKFGKFFLKVYLAVLVVVLAKEVFIVTHLTIVPAIVLKDITQRFHSFNIHFI